MNIDYKTVVEILEHHAKYTNAKVVYADTRKEYKVSEVIQCLLDLYKQEKERNIELTTDIDCLTTDLKDLEEIEKEHKEENGRLRDRIKELEKQYKILEVEKLRYNIQYLESDISQTPDTAMVYYSMKNFLETLREEKIKLETELQELLEESEK